MKSLLLPAAILGASLSAAWLQFTAEPDKIGDNETLVMANQATQIQHIDWVSTKQEVHIEQRTDDLGAYLWVQYIDKKIPEEPSTKYFIAGDNGLKLLNALSPLVAIRPLDQNTELEALGLAEASATLTITSNGKPRVFSVGDEAYGTKDLYVRDDESNELFLIDDSKFRNLRQARTTLPNRALFPKSPKESISAVLQWNDQTLHLTHQNAQDVKNAKWVYTDKPDVDSTQVQTWLSKALRISVSRSAAPDEDLSALTPQLSMTLTWDDGTESTTVYSTLPEDGSWWASNPSTRGSVRVSGKTLSALMEDIPSLFQE